MAFIAKTEDTDPCAPVPLNGGELDSLRPRVKRQRPSQGVKLEARAAAVKDEAIASPRFVKREPSFGTPPAVAPTQLLSPSQASPEALGQISPTQVAAAGVLPPGVSMRNWKHSAEHHGRDAQLYVAAQEDPGSSILHDIAEVAVAVYEHLVGTELPSVALVHEEVRSFTPQNQDVFFAHLTEKSYNLEAIMTACGLDEPQESQATHEVLYEHFKSFFLQCLSEHQDADALRERASQIPVDAVADRFLAKTLQHISQCHGLPADGIALHVVLQGKAAFLHFGAERNVACRILRETESTWDLCSHRASVFLVGDSAAGKDTVLHILHHIDKELAVTFRANLVCLNSLRVGHPTYNGLIAALRKGTTPNGVSVLVWYNSEIKACITNKEHGLREEHLCQIAEGTEVGKRTQDEEVIVKPNVWFVIGAQPDALLDRFGSTDNGRLRAFCAFLDRKQCTKIKFAAKLLKRNISMDHIINRMKFIVETQQCGEQPTVMQHYHQPAAYTVASALHDALSDALQATEVPPAIAATMIKFVTKGHGTLSVANVALRNGAWQSPCSGTLPIDDAVRFEDALTAAVQIKRHILNQLATEADIKAASLAKHIKDAPLSETTKAAARVKLATDASPSETCNLPVEVQACRRFFDLAVAKKLLGQLQENGLPAVARKEDARVLINLRDSAFIDCLSTGQKYGDAQALQKFGRATGWKEFLFTLQTEGFIATQRVNAHGIAQHYRLLRGEELSDETKQKLLAWKCSDEVLQAMMA